MKLIRLTIAALLLLIIGCSSASFESDADELEYLSSLSQPSVAQYHRKKELMLKAEHEFLAKEKAISDSVQADINATLAAQRETDAILERDRLAREKEIETNAEVALKEAGEWADKHAGSEAAGDHYRKVADDYPGTSQAWIASVRLKELEGR